MAVSQKPYLLRALYEWMLDSDLVPYLVVAEPSAKGHVGGVPAHLLEQESLTLNISPTATKDLVIGNEWIEFHTRFSGQSHHVFIATPAVIAIFDRDTEQGLSFMPEPLPEKTDSAETVLPAEKESAKPAKASHLKIIK